MSSNRRSKGATVVQRRRTERVTEYRAPDAPYYVESSGVRIEECDSDDQIEAAPSSGVAAWRRQQPARLMPPPKRRRHSSPSGTVSDDDQSAWTADQSFSRSPERSAMTVMSDDRSDSWTDVPPAPAIRRRTTTTTTTHFHANEQESVIQPPPAAVSPTSSRSDEDYPRRRHPLDVGTRPRSRSRGSEASRSSSAAREYEIAHCQLCNEEQYYLRCLDDQQSSSGDQRAKASVARETLKFQREIHELERMLSLSQSDESVFAAMLFARRSFVEKFLDRHSIEHRKWTLPMIRRHYDVRRGHRFDAERVLLDELSKTTKIADKIRSSSLITMNPDDGSERVDLKAAETYLKCSKRRQELVGAVEQTKMRRASADLAADRAASIVQALRSSEALALGAPPSGSNRIDLYNTDDF